MLKKDFNISNSDYQSNQPVPHAVIDDLWEIDIIKDIEKEFGVFEKWDGTKNFYGSQFKKYCGSYDNLPIKTKKIIEYCNSPTFIKKLETLTGINNLISDFTLKGGGMHSTGSGGFLEMHADFNYHNDLKLYRRLNVLIYLNSNWNKEFAGDLILTDKKNSSKVHIEPIINRTVIFTTDENSIHGHPEKMKLPENKRRNSIALYYYTESPPDVNFTKATDNTDYHLSIFSRIKIKLKSILKL